MKSDHHHKLSEISNQIQEERKMQYIKTEQYSKSAEKSINQSRVKEHKVKEVRRIKLHDEEEQAKLNQVKFHETRQTHIKQNKIEQLSSLRRKQIKKQKELKKLGDVEMELIQKQSQSQAAYLQVKNKLDSLLNSVKQQNKNSKQIMKPSVHLTGFRST